MTFGEAHRLIKQGDIVALRRALADGLDPNLANRLGWTLLMLAAPHGNVGIGELLLSFGGEIGSQNRFGETALSLAAQKGHEPFVRWVLANGASTAVRPHGRTLADWIEETSGLPAKKIEAVLTLLRVRSSRAAIH